MYNNVKPHPFIFDALKKAFPYFVPSGDDGTEVFYSAQVGTSDEFNVLIRINVGYHNKNEITFGVVDDERRQFLYDDINSLKEKVSDIIKKRVDKITKEKKDSMMTDLESMKLCGFLTRNGLTFSIEKHMSYTIVNIFGTAFQKLQICIYKKDPNSYVILTPKAALNQSQLENFILTCKALKE